MTRTTAVLTALLIAGLFMVRVAARSDAVSAGNRGLVAFGSTRGGDEDLYAVNPSNGNVTELVNTAALERDAAWSPNGLTIAYVRSTNSVPKDVWSIPAAGGSPTQVTNTAVAEKSPDWSPDGTQLVMSGGNKLWTVTAGGGTPVELSLTGTPPAVSFQEPSWGPDGRIAFFGGDVAFGETDVYVTNADGSGTHKVWDSGSGGSVYGPSWAPDGSRIVFAYGVGAALT